MILSDVGTYVQYMSSDLRAKIALRSAVGTKFRCKEESANFDVLLLTKMTFTKFRS